MNCFNLYDVNLINQSTMTPSTENAQFPVSNLNDNRRSKVFRSITGTDNIIFDFQETSEINGIFIVPNKRDGFGISTITLEFNHSSDFNSPAYSVSIPLSTQLNLGHISFTSIFYRFCRVVMTSTLGYCELSKIFIGKSIPMTRSINFGWTVKDEELSTKTKNRYGQIFTDLISRQKVLGFAFKNIDKSDLELINTMLDRVGENKPFYITVGNNTMMADYRRFAGPVVLEDIPTVTNAHFNKYNLSMSVKELM